MSDFGTEFAKFKRPEQIIKEALTTELNELLEQLTAEQQGTFLKLFPDVLKLKNDKLIVAIDLCQRSIAKSRAAQ